jgi:hypothetical protein
MVTMNKVGTLLTKGEEILREEKVLSVSSVQLYLADTEEHLYMLLELARREGLTRVFAHVFADGRDTPPRSALTYIDRAVTLLENGLGAAHPDLATQLSNRGEILNALGRYGEARKSFERARVIWERELGLENRNLGYALTGIGISFLAEGSSQSALVPSSGPTRSARRKRPTPPTGRRPASRWPGRSGTEPRSAGRAPWRGGAPPTQGPRKGKLKVEVELDRRPPGVVERGPPGAVRVAFLCERFGRLCVPCSRRPPRQSRVVSHHGASASRVSRGGASVGLVFFQAGEIMRARERCIMRWAEPTDSNRRCRWADGSSNSCSTAPYSLQGTPSSKSRWDHQVQP